MSTSATPAERIATAIYPNSEQASAAVAQEIAALMRARAAEGKTVVLGLATGSTPTRLYEELVRLHREEGLSFQNVVSFNLDEYYPMTLLSPLELTRKRRSIFTHQSQKDRPLFPGADQREFWQRAEDRNRTTARLYDQLGLSEYEAIEAFVRWHF